ncbi:MAG TPA: nuclear transport factor 2 family protein [Polyangiaceae bacterium]
MTDATTEHPNVTVYKRMIAAFNNNDLSAVEALVHPEMVYFIPGKSPLACNTRGVAEHVSVLRRARELSAGTLRLEPRAFAADGDFLFIWGRISAQRPGKSLDSEHCVMYKFSEGKVVEGRTIPLDLYRFDEFWS